MNEPFAGSHRTHADLLAFPALLTSLSITVDHRSSLSMIPRAIETRATRDCTFVQNTIYRYVIIRQLCHSPSQTIAHMHVQVLFVRVTWRTSVPRPVIFVELVIPPRIAPRFTHRYFFSSVSFPNRNVRFLSECTRKNGTVLRMSYPSECCYALRNRSGVQPSVLSLMPKNIGHISLFFSLKGWSKRIRFPYLPVYLRIFLHFLYLDQARIRLLIED